MPAPVVIVGAGLAGASAAAHLSASREVWVLDDGHPGATHAAAGLVNPFLGRKARPAWRHAEALAALRELSGAVGGPVVWEPILRPAADAKQAAVFRERASECPGGLSFLDASAAAARAPGLIAPHGALVVHEGGRVELGAFARALLDLAQRQGARVVRGSGRGFADLAGSGATVLLCAGRGLAALAPELPLHAVKGQTVRLRPAGGWSLLPIAGRTYLLPAAGGTVVVGATFEHGATDPAPTDRATADLHARAAALAPALADAPVVEARAGFRMTVPAAVRPGRLPLVGPVPGREGVWAFGGLGAKGLLTAPLLARSLGAWLGAPAEIPPEVSTLGLPR